jgi:hypothetical protein
MESWSDGGLGKQTYNCPNPPALPLQHSAVS